MMSSAWSANPPDLVAGVEARGFIPGAAISVRLGAGFVPIRKTGKLPWMTVMESYDLEYGTDRLEVHSDAVQPGQKVLIVDDVLATGGTASAAVRPVARTSSTISTFWPGCTASEWTSRRSVPYSRSYDSMTVIHGSFPVFRMGTNPAPS